MNATRYLARAALGLSGLAAALYAGAAAAEPQPELGWGLPRDVSTEGWRIDQLLYSTTVFVVILFVVMVFLMVYASIAHNKKRREFGDYDHGSGKPAVRVALIISSIIFFVVDGNLFAFAMRDIGVAYWNFAQFDGKREPEIVRIEINAHQWAWDLRYAGKDQEFGTADDIVELNEMRVPVDTPIVVQMTSVDVIHSFYLPNLRMKFDAVPGYVNEFWFQVDSENLAEAQATLPADESGKRPVLNEFDIACAQHCGTNHYKMKGRLTVLSKEEWQDWAARASVHAERAYDKNDTSGHWGWAWREGE
jgi:cytochrome c oxidase subunit II